MRKLLPLVTLGVLLASSLAYGGTVTASDTATLSVTVGNEATIVVDPGSKTTTFTTSTAFTDYTATTNYHFQVRTTQGTGSGYISLAVTTDFSPAGGPSAYAPVNGDTLKVTASTASAGSAVVPANQVNATAQNIVTFGANAHGGLPGAVGTNGATGQVSWNLTNDPAYQTGTYTATATFTISAT